MTQQREVRAQDVAVIGMAGRFPGAPDLDTFWRIIQDGRDTITRGPQLGASVPTGPGMPPSEQFVAARGVLAGVEEFDAGFWGYTPKEASTLDPQHRLWLELAYQALESAGYARAGHGQVVSVFAGSFISGYLHGHLIPTRAALEEFLRLESAPSFALMVQNDPAFLPSRSAYKMNLRGPAINVQTGCSTSLVAIAQAVQSLLSFESDVALAGGVCIALPQNSGYFYQEGAITSRDGYCRPYDAKACGTVFGSGGGAVALRRLADAERDGDPILAVIRGVALNNDGFGKVSFHAPSVAGQAEVITMAHALAEVEPDSIGYVEGHGTATPMGDPIEVEALNQAFRRKTTAAEYCCLGSVKANVGHLDAAAGVAGFIRTVLALRHGVLPPTAHFEAPNPNLRLAGSPFFVLSQARPWTANGRPRRAGVSSFGIGGTNAHVVLEEYLPTVSAAVQPDVDADRPIELCLSAKEPEALDEATKRLAAHLAQSPNVPLRDLAATLRFRREGYACRRSVVVADAADAVAALALPERWDNGKTFRTQPKLVFAFPGQGSLRLEALARLLAGDAHFARHLAELAKPASDLLAFDVLAFCEHPDSYPDALTSDNARAQTVLYCVCVALARCLADQGITPDLVLGHSVGEWPAAYVSGQISAEDGLTAVFHRGRLMSTAGRGAALTVKAGEAQLVPLLLDGVTLACVNGAALCLLSGRPDDIKAMSNVLREQKLRHAALPIDVAVHSPLMDPAVAPFADILAALDFKAPSRPMVSSVTGAYFSADVEANRQYFSRQLRAQVRFDKAIDTLMAEPALLVLEVGVANTLTALLNAGFADPQRHHAVPLLPVADRTGMAQGLRRVPGILWAHGMGETRDAGQTPVRAVADLPTYPFQRKRYWVERPAPAGEAAVPAGTSVGQAPGPTVAETPESDETVDSRVTAMLVSASGLPASALEASRSLIELGFDSILLMQLEREIHVRFGLRVTWRQLLEDYPTPAKLKDFIRSSCPEPHRPASAPAAENTATPGEPTSIPRLTVLREAGPRKLFCSYDGEGQVLPYLKLARSMPPEFSLYGLLPVRLPNIPQVHTTVEDMARHCVSVIRQKQPRGPYLLGGLCAGGVIAFEIARQLEEAGEKVDWLVMFDTLNPQTPYRPLLMTRDRLKHFLRGAKGPPPDEARPFQPSTQGTVAASPSSAHGPGAGRLGRVAGKLGGVVRYEVKKKIDDAWTVARIHLLRYLMAREKPWPEGVAPLGELELFTVVRKDYHPGIIDANVVLVRAHLEAEGIDPPATHYVDDPLLGWSGHTRGKLETIDSAGGHVTMLLEEPWFGEIAASLSELLLR